jgi:hypothetical protein
LNLRNYKNNNDFTADEPWLYPGTKRIRPVVVDKGSFPAIGKMLKKSSED